jgi:hypothetical protein
VLCSARKKPFDEALSFGRNQLSMSSIWRASEPAEGTSQVQCHRPFFVFDDRSDARLLTARFLYWSVQSRIGDVNQISVPGDKKILRGDKF